MISATRHTVTDADPVLLVTAGDTTASGRDQTLLRNLGAESVYLGGSDVTAAAGYPFGSGETIGIFLLAGDDLYAIADTGDSVALAVLHTRAEDRP